MSIATSTALRCINGHFIAINISRAGQVLLGFCLLPFTFYLFIFNHQQFRSGRAMNFSPAQSPVRCTSP